MRHVCGGTSSRRGLRQQCGRRARGGALNNKNNYNRESPGSESDFTVRLGHAPEFCVFEQQFFCLRQARLAALDSSVAPAPGAAAEMGWAWSDTQQPLCLARCVCVCVVRSRRESVRVCWHTLGKRKPPRPGRKRRRSITTSAAAHPVTPTSISTPRSHSTTTPTASRAARQHRAQQIITMAAAAADEATVAIAADLLDRLEVLG